MTGFRAVWALPGPGWGFCKRARLQGLRYFFAAKQKSNLAEVAVRATRQPLRLAAGANGFGAKSSPPSAPASMRARRGGKKARTSCARDNMWMGVTGMPVTYMFAEYLCVVFLDISTVDHGILRGHGKQSLRTKQPGKNYPCTSIPLVRGPGCPRQRGLGRPAPA